jgi:hypothetical protein
LFSLGLTKSDLTASKASFKSLIEKFGANTTQVDNYLAALQSYLETVVANPTQAQKDAMTVQLNLFDPAETNFVQSFQGLANIATDPFFAADLRNLDFNTKRTLSSAAKTTLRFFPEKTYGFFTDPATATTFAEYIIAVIAVSDRIRYGV